jgi:hypothetical protein
VNAKLKPGNAKLKPGNAKLKPGNERTATEFIIFVSFERRLALPLLVARILADHPHHTAAADHLALVTDLFDAGSNFHS